MAKINSDEFIEMVLKGERDFSRQDLSGLCLKYRGPYRIEKATHERYNTLCEYLGNVKETFNFNGANLQGALMQDVRFYGGIHAVSANLQNTYFGWARLNNSIFLGANLEGAGFRAAYLYNSNFSGANLKAAEMKTAQLNGSVFDYANLTGADFKEAGLHGCLFRAAEMNGARMVSAQINSETCFDGAKNLDISEAKDWDIYKRIADARDMKPEDALKELQLIEGKIRTNEDRRLFDGLMKKICP